MKAYVKPDLFYESFELNQNIAACGWDLQSADKNSCVALKDPLLDNKHPYDELALFINSDACVINEKDTEDYCYTNGSSDYKRLYQS